ncbi:hypothetical protein [Rhodopseudomonas pseudopalustris]|uniref:Uncharacterized protein n=1 Tax=Rhodopseudomonas pseudopalustris TaxID=1513892 RepID=A0A1H8V9F8_9BRAD|nr:hypothetical protein [Rhodopseudomonas pseudopalustris]SEP12102.1 hypothetical protein SAMN05444123_108145 [Rhodopseudomonas pseudopalustris]
MSAAPDMLQRPSFADQVAAVEAIEVAQRIVTRGTRRAALGVSTVETVAMAHRLLALETLAAITFDMLAQCQGAAEVAPAQRDQLRLVTLQHIGDVAAQLERLGYAAAPSTTTEASPKES